MDYIPRGSITMLAAVGRYFGSVLRASDVGASRRSPRYACRLPLESMSQ